MERQDLSRTYLAHHELESVIIIIVIIVLGQDTRTHGRLVRGLVWNLAWDWDSDSGARALLTEQWHACGHGRHPASASGCVLFLRCCMMGFRSALVSGFKKVKGAVFERPSSDRTVFKVTRTCSDVHTVRSTALCD